MKGTRVVITGGAGFIGNVLAHRGRISLLIQKSLSFDVFIETDLASYSFLENKMFGQ